MNKSKIPDECASTVRTMAKLFSDSVIAERFDCTPAAVCMFRKRHAIPARRWARMLKPKPVIPQPTAFERYIDAEGMTITVCPIRYALGAGVTARPSVRH